MELTELQPDRPINPIPHKKGSQDRTKPSPLKRPKVWNSESPGVQWFLLFGWFWAISVTIFAIYRTFDSSIQIIKWYVLCSAITYGVLRLRFFRNIRGTFFAMFLSMCGFGAWLYGFLIIVGMLFPRSYVEREAVLKINPFTVPVSCAIYSEQDPEFNDLEFVVNFRCQDEQQNGYYLYKECRSWLGFTYVKSWDLYFVE